MIKLQFFKQLAQTQTHTMVFMNVLDRKSAGDYDWKSSKFTGSEIDYLVFCNYNINYVYVWAISTYRVYRLCDSVNIMNKKQQSKRNRLCIQPPTTNKWVYC